MNAIDSAEFLDAGLHDFLAVAGDGNISDHQFDPGRVINDLLGSLV